MTKETLNGMTKKERLAIYKNGEKQTAYYGQAGDNKNFMMRVRVVVVGNLAIDNLGRVYELSEEMGKHQQKFAVNYYPKWVWTGIY